jgi:integral membrane sensor domain MASE1
MMNSVRTIRISKMPLNRLLVILAVVIVAAGLSIALILALPNNLRVWLIPALLAVAIAARKFWPRR